MKPTLIGLALILTTATLSGCASLTKEQCRTGNWQAIGYTDGVAGRYPDRINDHSKACAKAGVTPDYQAWQRGRQEGLIQYCTSSNAYQLGRRGQQLNLVCPSNQSSELQSSNARGLEYHRLSQDISKDKNQLDKYQTQYKQLRDGEMLDFTDEKQARRYLSELPDKMRQLRLRINDNEQRLTQLQQQYGY